VKRKPGRRGLKGKLLDKSVEAYILSLEIINQLSVKYRVETFAHLICNAWELLLKAKIIEDAGSRRAIYYKKKRGQPRRSLSLRDCLKRVFLSEKDSTRRNVERITDLRDECVHLVISEVPKEVLGLFQACVINYHKLLNEWFDISLSDRVSVGMMTIVYDFSPEQFELSSPVLRRRLGRDAADYLTRYQAEVTEEFQSLGKPAEFSIDIDYKLALIKKPGKADIVLTKGDLGKVAAVVEVAKDPSKTHPFIQTEVYEQVRERLADAVRSRYDIQCIVQVYGIKKQSRFFYQGTVKNSPGQYSPEFVDWVVERYRCDNDFFTKARERAKSIKRG